MEFDGNDVKAGIGAAKCNENMSLEEFYWLTKDEGYAWPPQEDAFKGEAFKNADIIIITDFWPFSPARASSPGWGKENKHIWMGQNAFELLAHEWCHYKAGIEDRYRCWLCKRPPSICLHDDDNPQWGPWQPSPEYPYNIMNLGANPGLLPEDWSALLGTTY